MSMKCFILFTLLSVSSYFGPVLLLEIVLEGFEPDPASDPDVVNFGTMRMSRKGRNSFVISGTNHIYRNLGNEATVTMDIMMKDGPRGGYTRQIISKKQNLCEFLDSEDKFFPRLREVSNIPPKGTCPFPKGNITVDGFVFDEKMFPLLIRPGSYMLRGMTMEEEHFVMGYKIMLTIH